MKIWRWLSILLVLPAFLFAEALPIPNSKFVVKITPSQNGTQAGVPVWEAGASVVFIITMTNKSDQVLHFVLTNPDFNYRVVVLDSQGERVSGTETFKMNAVIVDNRRIEVTLTPDESCSDIIEVSHLYDLSKPGEYTVQLERDLPRELGTGVVTSNDVRITIQPSQPKTAKPQPLHVDDPAEYEAYMKAVQTTDWPYKLQMLERFLFQYPNSVLKAEVLKLELHTYQQLKSEDGAVRTAERLVSECEPGNLQALGLLAYTYRECAMRNGVNAKACGDKAISYGQRGLAALDKAQTPPDGLSLEDYEKQKTSLQQIFQDALGLAKRPKPSAQQLSAH